MLDIASVVAICYGASFCQGGFGYVGQPEIGVPIILAGVLGILCSILVFRSLVIVTPNHSKVIVLFGKYKGTLRHDGFFAVNPFASRREVSLRAHNFNSDKLKVNDLRGNPIEIGAVVVWRVRDTAQATFDVEDFESYVQVQTESALRHHAAQHAKDYPPRTEI